MGEFITNLLHLIAFKNYYHSPSIGPPKMILFIPELKKYLVPHHEADAALFFICKVPQPINVTFC